MKGLALAGIVTFGLLTAGSCGGTSDNVPANTPGAVPNDAASVNCPAEGGPSSGVLTGLGATIGQFRQAHAQDPDPQLSSEFGAIISGGPNDGHHEMTARCSAGGVIVSVDQNLSRPMTEAEVRSGLVKLGIAPPDSRLVSKQTPGTCELLFYSSALISTDPGANDTAGTFVIELASNIYKVDKSGMALWIPSDVESLIYDLDQGGGC